MGDTWKTTGNALSLALCLIILFTHPALAQGYEEGYTWAKNNDISDFTDCQLQFGAGDAEDGCKAYIQRNYTGEQPFHGYECAEDCTGIEAGYAWAEQQGITNPENCSGGSQPFLEGCRAYANQR